MTSLLLHIGIGKTGTSSLQSYLSRTAARHLGSSKYRYCVATTKGQLLYGRRVVRLAESNPLGYASSDPELFSIDQVDRLKKSLARLIEKGTTPILSQEDWSRTGEQFIKTKFFERLGFDVEVCAYVRPQVDWFNSGWWQWFAWGGGFNEPDDVIRAWGYGFLRWADYFSWCSKIPNLKRLSVRLHCRDVIDDFLSSLNILDAEAQSARDRRNQGLSPSAIQFYRSLPNTRRPHHSLYDARINEYLQDRRASPWVLSQSLVSGIIENTSESNQRLMQLLDENQREAMASDPRWWSAAAYFDRVVEDGHLRPLDPQVADSVARTLGIEQ